MNKIFKTYHYTQLKNITNCEKDPITTDCFGLTQKKRFKIKVKKKKVYTVELFYYPNFAFIKFHPSMYDDYEDKYKIVGMGLSYTEKKRLLNTCCKIVYDEIQKDPTRIFAFIGQWYDKDNALNRDKTIRFSIYKKLVTTVFTPDKYSQLELEAINFFCISLLPKKKLTLKTAGMVKKLWENADIMFSFMTKQRETQILEQLNIR